MQWAYAMGVCNGRMQYAPTFETVDLSIINLKPIQGLPCRYYF
jgi:hypothetical protein